MIEELARIDGNGTDSPVIVITGTNLTLEQARVFCKHVGDLIHQAEISRPAVVELMEILESRNGPDDTIEDMALAVARAGFRKA